MQVLPHVASTLYSPGDLGVQALLSICHLAGSWTYTHARFQNPTCIPRLQISTYAGHKVSSMVYHGLQDDQVVPLAVNVVIGILWATWPWLKRAKALTISGR